jgi:broad specificity phosphatase PhoE
MLYLVRHGQPLSELALADSPLVSDSENCLTELGLAQATRLAGQFSKLGDARVFCSPLVRALQTAQPIAARFGVNLEVDARLSERDYSRISGLTVKAWREVQERGYLSPSTSIAGEETVELQRKRVESWYADLEPIIRAAPEKNLIVVCHGGTIEHLLAIIMKTPVTSMSRYFFSCECSSVCKISPLVFNECLVLRIDAINSLTI